MRATMSWTVLLGLVATMSLATGCSSAPRAGKYNVAVALDAPVVQSPDAVAVHVIGVNSTSLPEWETKSISAYWMPNDSLRGDTQGKRWETSFGPGNTGAKTLSRDDPIWNVWMKEKSMHLVIVADVPGVRDQSGERDPRRIILPLARDRWEKNQTIQIVVQRGRITCITPPKEPKQK